MAKDERLIVYNYLHLPLAVLDDYTENRARNIELNLVVSGVNKLSFDLPLGSEKWFYVSNDNLVMYKGQMYVIQIPNMNKSSSGSMVSVECTHIGGNLEGKLNVAFGKTDLVGKTVQEIMTVVLEGSGWTIGDVDVPNTTMRGLIVNEQSIMANVKKVAELFDCSYIFDANLDYKKIHFKQAATDDLMVIREGVNMRSIGVTIDKSNIITRLLVTGANDPITNRPITVYGATMKDELGNILYELDGITPKIYDKTYIEDYSYYLNVGYEQSYIDAHPEYFLKESILNMSDYVDKTDLLFDAMKTLRTSCKPKIDVTFDMADKMDNDNLFLHTPRLNEMVYVYAKEINDKLNIKTTTGYNGNMFQMKVSEVKTNSEKPDSCSVTARNYSQYEGIVQTLISNADAVNKLIQTDGTVPTNRLQGFIDILATKLNSTQSHWFTDESGNLVFENDLNTDAMKLGGGIFGIANSKLPDGSWNWRTFGTGAGFTADAMNTGTLNADLVKAGTIRSFDDSVVIDLDTGYFNFKDKIVYDITGMKIVGAVTFESLVPALQTQSTNVEGWTYTGKTTINGGKIETDSITALQIAANAITASEIAADAITSTKIKAGEVLAGHIKAGEINAGHLGANSVTAVKIDANAVTASKILAGEINANHLASNSVTASKILAGEINANHLGANSVTASKILAGEITSGHVNASGITADKIKTGSLNSTNGVSNINLDNGTFNFGSGKIIYDGSNVTIKDVNGNILIETSKGIANEQNFGSTQNVQSGYPLNMSFKIGSSTSVITSVELKLKQYNFRTDSAGAAEDATRTSGASSATSSGASSRSSTDERWNTGVYNFATAYSDVIGSHAHVIPTAQFGHDHGMAHTHTMPHTHSTPAHSHGVQFGILETPNENGTIDVYIDGTYRLQTTNTDITLDISTWVTTTGTHTLELRSPNMKRIQADVFIKSYIRR